MNQTFSQYSELGAEHLELMHDGKIDSRGFDVLMERLLIEDGTFIVDNGASLSFRSGATSSKTTSSNCSAPAAGDCAFTR